MPDASTIDPAAVLQRVDEIEEQYGEILTPLIPGPVLQWLCQHLRTALADTRRVDYLETRSIQLEYGDEDFPKRGVWQIIGGVNDREWTLRGTGETTREAIDAAMAATPRETT